MPILTNFITMMITALLTFFLIFLISDMYVQKRRCDMKTCLSPKGRDVSELDTEFEIVLCSLCGINGVHGKCGNINLKSAAQVKDLMEGIFPGS